MKLEERHRKKNEKKKTTQATEKTLHTASAAILSLVSFSVSCRRLLSPLVSSAAPPSTAFRGRSSWRRAPDSPRLFRLFLLLFLLLFVLPGSAHLHTIRSKKKSESKW